MLIRTDWPDSEAVAPSSSPGQHFRVGDLGPRLPHGPVRSAGGQATALRDGHPRAASHPRTRRVVRRPHPQFGRFHRSGAHCARHGRFRRSIRHGRSLFIAAPADPGIDSDPKIFLK